MAKAKKKRTPKPLAPIEQKQPKTPGQYTSDAFMVCAQIVHMMTLRSIMGDHVEKLAPSRAELESIAATESVSLAAALGIAIERAEDRNHCDELVASFYIAAFYDLVCDGVAK